MLGENELRGLAEHVLRQSTADETEVLILGRASRLTRFANNYIHQNVAETGVQVRVRAALGQKVGVAATDDTTPDGLGRVVERALALARLQTPDPFYPGLLRPDGGPQPAALGYAAATAAFTPEERAREAGVICGAATAANLIGAGAFSTGEEAFAVANSHGLWRYHLGTKARLTTVVMGPSGSGWASAVDTDAANINAEGVADRAVDIANQAQDPIEITPGEYPVVLGPDAVADMMGYLAYVGFNGLAVHEGRSFVATRLGQQVMAPGVTIWDDGLDPAGLPMPFDFEGTPKQPVSLIEAGIAKGATWDRRSATVAGAGHQSTGHALPAPNSTGALPVNIFMKPGEADEDDLLAGIERGIWITRFWYTRVVHPLEVVMTGMTRDGTFLIEDGRITRPVRNLRFTQSYLAALAGVEAIGREGKLIDGGFGTSYVPAIRVGRFNFTGVTRE